MGVFLDNCLSLARRLCSLWDADGGGAHITMSVLVIASLRVVGVEIEFDVDRVGSKELGKGVVVWVDPELLKAGTPLFGVESV